MSPEDRAAKEEYLMRDARDDFALYCQIVYRGLWKPYPHSQFLCEVLEQVEKGEIKKLIITMPPQFGKSLTVTESFPSWFIGKHPDKSVIEISYSDDYARKFGGSNLSKIRDFGKRVFDVQIDPKRSSDTHWKIAGRRGTMISAGVGGGVTGSGADGLLLDDPIKNHEEANSEVYREKLWNEWQNTFRTRVQPNGWIIVIHTRWHNDDLTGRILTSSEAKEWTVVNLPLTAVENDPLGRQPGDILWPEGKEMGGEHDIAWVKAQKIAVGAYAWESQYEGRPTPPGGEILKKEWWRFYKELPVMDEVVQSWDCAFKDMKTSSRVSGQVWGRQGANCYLLGESTDLMDFPKTLKEMIRMARNYPKALKKYVEDKANGTAAVAVLKNKVPGLILVEPEGGKVSRAQAITGLLEAGNVYLPDPVKAPWVLDFIQECSSFPRGKYSDRVDAMSQCLVKWCAVPIRDPSKEFKLEQAAVTASDDESFADLFADDGELGDLFG